MGWAVMFNGAWDYPADIRGYTWGWVHEFHTRNWSLRYASAAKPRVANGLRFDRRLFVNRGDEVEGEYRCSFRQHPGACASLDLYRTTPTPAATPRPFSDCGETATARFTAAPAATAL